MRDVYKERSQPKFRVAKVGTLPKKQDYVIRAAKQNAAKQKKKETKLKIEKKNPNEYYSYMKNAKKNEKTGITEVYRLPELDLLPHEALDEIKTKEKVGLFRMNDSKFTSKQQRVIVSKKVEGNLNLLRTRAQVMRNKLKRMIESYSGLNGITMEGLFSDVTKDMKERKEAFDKRRLERKEKKNKKNKFNKPRKIQARNEELEEGSSSSSSSDDEDFSLSSDSEYETEDMDLKKMEDQILGHSKSPKNVKHTIFVDDESELKKFDPEERFDTDKSLLSNPLYRLKKSQLEDISTPNLGLNDKSTEQVAADVLRQQLDMKMKAQKIMKIENAIRAIQTNKSKLFSKTLPNERKK